MGGQSIRATAIDGGRPRPPKGRRDRGDDDTCVKSGKAGDYSIPIVFTTISDPVQIGFVASLSRPGGNVTGVTLLSVEVGPKLLELLRGAAPSAAVMGLLVNPTNPNAESQVKNTQAAALKLGLQLQVLNASAESEFDAAFD